MLISVVIDYSANTINTNTRNNINNKMMIANVSTKIYTSIGTVIESRSANNTNIINIDNMIINTSIVNINIILINI